MRPHPRYNVPSHPHFPIQRTAQNHSPEQRITQHTKSPKQRTTLPIQRPDPDPLQRTEYQHSLLARRPALGTPEGIQQVTLGHEHQRPGRLLRFEVGRGQTSLHVTRDAARHRTDEAFDQAVPVNLLDPGVVARCISDRSQHRSVLNEGLRTRSQRFDQNFLRVLTALPAREPTPVEREQQTPYAFQQPRHHLIAVTEIRIEGGSGQTRSGHYSLHGHLPEWPRLQKRARRCQYHPLGLLRPASPARTTIPAHLISAL